MYVKPTYTVDKEDDGGGRKLEVRRKKSLRHGTDHGIHVDTAVGWSAQDLGAEGDIKLSRSIA